MKQTLLKTLLVAIALGTVLSLPRLARAGDGDYSFKVHNTTEHKITGLMCSEDGETYGNFDIGDGIKPGDSMTLVWDKSTHSQSCHQYFKAEFEDESESKPVQFDFCKAGLELDF
jgi:hypothetical protein